MRQAEDRAASHIRTLDNYFLIRRDTIGAKPSFVLLEFDQALSDAWFNHPLLKGLTEAAIDLLILGNVKRSIYC